MLVVVIDGIQFREQQRGGVASRHDRDLISWAACETVHVVADALNQTIDQPGVGQLVLDAVSRGRSTRADLKLGVCGEHGGDPESIDFFYRAGLDYVSCSPFRVPIARLAAAQAVIAHG